MAVRLVLLGVVVAMAALLIWQVWKRRPGNRLSSAQSAKTPGKAMSTPAGARPVTTSGTTVSGMASLAAGIWERVISLEEGVWYDTRNSLRFRFWVVGNIVATNARLYVERMSSEHPMEGRADVEIFQFLQGDDTVRRRLVVVTVIRGKVPKAYESGESVVRPQPQIQDDDLRRLTTDISMGQKAL
jgi:hypothetical protein